MSVYLPTQRRDLNEREHVILRAIVQLFILHATPVGSRIVARFLEHDLSLSAATIRNTMADLEAMGYITHPHTSAGRMPTDLGYRYYVDTLVDIAQISEQDQDAVARDLMGLPRESVTRDASRILGSLSRHLALVQIPQLSDALVHKVELMPLSSERLLVIIALESNLVRTLTLETTNVHDANRMDHVARLLNERIAGRPLSTIAEAVEDLVADSDKSSLLRLFIDHVGMLAEPTSSTIHIAGAQNLIHQPEFDDPSRLRSVIELVENEDVIVHLLGEAAIADGVAVRIGNEIHDEVMRDYSLIATTYRAGAARGTLGIIGPRRMDYGRMISLVQLMSNLLSRTLNSSGTP